MSDWKRAHVRLMTPTDAQCTKKVGHIQISEIDSSRGYQKTLIQNVFSPLIFFNPALLAVLRVLLNQSYIYTLDSQKQLHSLSE